MRKRDGIILVLVTIGVLFSFMQGGGYFSFEIEWRVPIETSLYANGISASEEERLPTPLIVDIDGDGHNELIVVTADYTIKIYNTVPIPSLATPQLPTLSIKAEASLLPAIGLQTGRYPAALGTGFTSVFQEGTRRERVIVVVTNGWTVLMFDSSLKLIWESNVLQEFDSNYYHKEISIMIAPVSIRVGDKGVVIVGGKLSPKASAEVKTHKMDFRHDGDDDVEEDHGQDEPDHFSYYAFDGRTGAIRWKHESGDFYGIDLHEKEKKSLLPEHSYKLHVISEMKHLGERDWQEFQSYILSELPTSWYSKEDTKFSLRRFKKTYHTGGGPAASPVIDPAAGATVLPAAGMAAADPKAAAAATAATDEAGKESTWNPETIGMPRDHHLHIPGLPFGGHEPHTKEDFVKKANVIVAHLSTGLEVIHIYTGRPVCNVPLPTGGGELDGEGSHGNQYFDEINGDGLIETIRLVENPEKKSFCYAQVYSGAPEAVIELFNVSLCYDEKGGFLSRLFEAGGIINPDTPDETSTKKKQRDKDFIGVRPANVLFIKSANSFWRQPGENEKDMIFFVSSGMVSSYDAKGNLNWQISTSSEWISGFESTKTHKQRERARRRRFERLLFWASPYAAAMSIPTVTPATDEAFSQAFDVIMPSIEVIYPEIYSKVEYLIAVGQWELSLISPVGEVITEVPLVEPPVSRMSFGDFNNDGMTDVVITGRTGYYGYSLHVSSTGSLIFPILVSFLLLIMILCFVYANMSDHYDEHTNKMKNKNKSKSTQKTSTPKKRSHYS